jgi:hypothetical protein
MENKEITAEQLVQVLKFTPRTYTISLWGYGGEKVMGTVDKKIFDYFKHRRIDLSDYAWDGDYADDNNIPEDMQPFPPGSWYECDNMAHVSGVSRSAGTLQISDENSETVFEKSLDDIVGGGCDGEPDWCCNDEAWIGSRAPGEVVFIGNSNEKGTFFEGEINLAAPFDIELLELHYDEVDGEEIVNGVYYDGEEIDNNGGSSNGKSSDFGFYLVKDSNSWETYRNADDIVYEMTPWFPKKIKPVHVGLYMIRPAGKSDYTYQCQWTGSKWVSSYIEPAEFDSAEEVKIKEWQGLANDPRLESAWDPVVELDKIIATIAPTDLNTVIEELSTEAKKWPF